MTDSQCAEALRRLTGADLNRRAFPVLSRIRDQRDHLARLLREARDSAPPDLAGRIDRALEALR